MSHYIKLIHCLPYLFLLAGCAGWGPKPLGITNGRLHPCPPAPKCVSSYYTQGIHHVDPIQYSGPYSRAYTDIITIIQGIDRSRIVSQDDVYIHAQFKVTIFNWVDDTEFLFDDERKIIHISSSASAPVGYWDWGENKRRVEYIRRQFQDLQE